MPIRPELLEIIVCPVSDCHGRLRAADDVLTCERCGLRYPVEEDWPVLIPEEALGTNESSKEGLES